MMHIITGNNGFVGGNLTHFLKNYHHNVLGVSRNPEGKNAIPYKQVTIDQCKNSSSIIHLAGKAHDLKKTANDSDYFTVNTELTKQLFDTFLQSDCPVFIYMSSVKAVADAVDGVLSEDIVPNPITPYGKSKLAAENYIVSKEIPETKRVYILRPCMIHGPNNKGNLNLLYSFVAKGIPYPFGAYKNKRSFVSVENLCFIIHELLTNQSIPSGVYNIADDMSLATNEVVQIMGETMDKKARILNIPKFLIQSVARLGDVVPIPVNSERLKKLTENYVVSNEKIKQAINKELPLTAKEGLKKTIASFKK